MCSKLESRTSRNVVIIGHSGVGKSSLINMLCPSADAPVSNDVFGCTTTERAYLCDLGRQQSCMVHDTIGLEEGSWGFLWAPKAERRLKSYLKKSKPHLVVYCMPGVRRYLKKSYGRSFNKFKSMAGKVPIVVVVNHLEDSRHSEDWWSANLDVLRKIGIPESTQHACVTTLPEVDFMYEIYGSSKRGIYDSSREAVKALIMNNLPQY
ncbi:P-loop containing nucleoside triphosphate hydrolase protein [Suillus fuscotomentosus]|uniref:P-loop containing nucleoside triphosphate hydrolase protein n=1 Tax=Suillus fuscotomentosus TaxID=1912939 RepID=A0AAD4DQA6_9AGAM|nr:P-loop containing nucleoside triphosphate hydrolase protein [Suillus fuscotomentosus]KAG1889655.1 P-loop containing nucleoside triphosphate hydrolase protein [Suillus fuscotomentosus]